MNGTLLTRVLALLGPAREFVSDDMPGLIPVEYYTINGQPDPYEAAACLAELIAVHSAGKNTLKSVTSEGTSVTYAPADFTQLAQQLRALGARYRGQASNVLEINTGLGWPVETGADYLTWDDDWPVAYDYTVF